MSKLKQKTHKTIQSVSQLQVKKKKQPIKYCHLLENYILSLFFLGFHQSLALSKKYPIQ